ncbi:hypothetical protein C8A03DRAFT_37582 [Achaetomium macrosporum]|uniref:Uncharacterized protein n=1 Tax=Achaetomium macrosporum TaxID=79813 RepID=A0AAN7C433_9PEZI|nr:hypothetical protein C8A03DRAFT_37582 [Achaetomium macrosporum]
MGTRYSRIVETCLTCLDHGSADFGDEREFQDVDGVAVEARYYIEEKAVQKPAEISV